MIHHADDWLTIHGGDARAVLRELPDASVHCVVTSPPYWGLRDYGSDGQLGLEATPDEYVANLVTVFREVRRVLRDDGTLWLNLGDSYATTPPGNKPNTTALSSGLPNSIENQEMRRAAQAIPKIHGLKPKDLVGIPWRVAFALQADGWWLRSDIIWSKPNPMPESVTDRPTKAHEYLFLLAKRERYYFDQEAVREASQPSSIERMKHGWNGNEDRAYVNGKQNHLSDYMGTEKAVEQALAGRNLRSVWTIATRPYPGAHFAVFPPELPERCIKAGTSERGVCPDCGAPWRRVMTVLRGERDDEGRNDEKRDARRTSPPPPPERGWEAERTTTGWERSCRCPTPGSDPEFTNLTPVPAVVLDPFAGSGTVGLVANRLSRRAILIDLNPAYLEQQMKRNAQVPLGV